MWTLVGPRNHALHGGTDPPQKEAVFGWGIGTYMGALWLARGYYIHLYSHKLQLQKEEIEKKSKEKERHATCQRTQRAKCMLNMHSGSAR